MLNRVPQTVMVKDISMRTSKRTPIAGLLCNSHRKGTAISAANNATAMIRVGTCHDNPVRSCRDPCIILRNDSQWLHLVLNGLHKRPWVLGYVLEMVVDYPEGFGTKC